MPRKKPEPTKRPYKLDYGTTQGHSATPRNATLSALRYMKIHGRKHVVIEQPGSRKPVDIWWSGAWGVVVKERK